MKKLRRLALLHLTVIASIFAATSFAGGIQYQIILSINNGAMTRGTCFASWEDAQLKEAAIHADSAGLKIRTYIDAKCSQDNRWIGYEDFVPTVCVSHAMANWRIRKSAAFEVCERAAEDKIGLKEAWLKMNKEAQ